MAPTPCAGPLQERDGGGVAVPQRYERARAGALGAPGGRAADAGARARVLHAAVPALPHLHPPPRCARLRACAARGPSRAGAACSPFLLLFLRQSHLIAGQKQHLALPICGLRLLLHPHCVVMPSKLVMPNSWLQSSAPALLPAQRLPGPGTRQLQCRRKRAAPKNLHAGAAQAWSPAGLALWRWPSARRCRCGRAATRAAGTWTASCWRTTASPRACTAAWSPCSRAAWSEAGMPAHAASHARRAAGG